MKIRGSDTYRSPLFVDIRFEALDLEALGIKTYNRFSAQDVVNALSKRIEAYSKAESICVRDHTALGILKKLVKAIEETENIRKAFMLEHEAFEDLREEEGE